METAISPNGSKQSQKSTTIDEEITFITDVEAQKKSTRLIVSRESHYSYFRAFDRLQDEKGKWCHIKTDDYKRTRKIVETIAKMYRYRLVIQRSVEGLQFRLATEEEIEKRKETGDRLVAARGKE